MSATTIAKRLDRLERPRGKRVRLYRSRLPTPTADTVRETLRTLIAIGAMEFDGTAIRRKERNDGDASHGRERSESVAG
jgi:hypothetical protein